LVPTSSRRTAHWKQSSVNHFLEEQFGTVIEATQVDQLSQELDAGLGTEELESRHVDVVNEDSDLLKGPGTEEGLALLNELALDGQLHVFGLGLC
jgi:hypothetical protein